MSDQPSSSQPPAPDAAATPTPEPAAPRKSGWLRFQFGLQSVLLLTLLAAAGIKWYFQPIVLEEQLAGGAIKIRRQVRYEGELLNGPLIGNTTASQRGSRGGARAPVNVGWWILYDEQERIRIKGRYTAGVPTGRWAAFYENGQIQLESQYAFGKPHGKWEEWFESGAKRLEMNFVTGEPQGPIQRWHENGQLECQGEYAAGQRSGTWTFWHPDGKKRCEAEFDEDEPDGAWFTWDVKGKRQPLFGPGRQEPIDTDQVIPELVTRVKGNDLRSRHDAAWALSQFGELSAAPLASLLADSDPEIRALAASSLAKLRRRAASVTPQLIAALRDSDERVQAGAARALGAVGPAAVAARPQLAKVIPGADPWLLPELLAADMAIAPDDPQARSALLGWALSVDLGVVEQQPAVMALVNKRQEMLVADLIQNLDGANPGVRAAAIGLLSRLLADHAQPALEKLRRLATQDADVAVRKQAQQAVETLERRFRTTAN